MSELQKLRDKFYMMNTMIDDTCEAILKDVERISKPSGFIAVQEIKQLLTQKEKEE